MLANISGLQILLKQFDYFSGCKTENPTADLFFMSFVELIKIQEKLKTVMKLVVEKVCVLLAVPVLSSGKHVSKFSFLTRNVSVVFRVDVLKI